jgi:hypothetical protein
MPSFREVRRVRPEGFHCHHLIPIEVIEKPSLAITFGMARSAGFNPDDFEFNGMLLPSVEGNAVSFRLPMHRGSHPLYNALVAERIAGFPEQTPFEVKMQLHLLQFALKQGLRSRTISVLHRQRDPLRPMCDLRRIDGEIDLLWEVTRLGKSL